MENLIIYLLKASGLVVVFYTAYYTLLRKETFFTSNRSFLLAGLVTSAIMPLLVLTHTVWVEATEKVQVQLTPQELQQYLQMQQMAAMQSQPEPTNWYNVAGYVYIAGVMFFLFRFVYQLYLVRKMLKGKNIIKADGFKYIDSEAVHSPFSFFSYIVYNSKLLTDNELENILSHERVHSRQKHSADMILSNLFCIALWFNPFIWFYKKAVAQNLEFIADAVAIKQITDTKAYQKTLLKITVQPECTAIINHFYQSLIKKRIVMLNKKQSNTRNSWKYAAVVPLLVAFMVLFQLEVRAQQTEEAAEQTVYTSTKIALEVNKDSKDEALEAEKKFFKSEYNTDVEFSDITRNDKGEITAIKVTINDGTEESTYQVKGPKPINAFTVELATDNNGKVKTSFGVAQGLTIKGNIIYNNTDEDTLFLRKQDVLIQKDVLKNRQGFKEPTTQQPAGSSGHWTLSNWKFGDKDALVIINGVKQEKGKPIKIQLNEEISEVKVLTPKEAKKKYGKEGKNGAMEVITQKGQQQNRYTTYTFTEALPGSMRMYIGENNIDYDEIIAEATRMRTFADIDFESSQFISADDFKVLEHLSPDEIEALKAQLTDAQEIVKQLSNGSMQTFTFTTDEFESARASVEEARATLEEKRKMINARREEMLEKKQNAINEREKARAEKKKELQNKN